LPGPSSRNAIRPFAKKVAESADRAAHAGIFSSPIGPIHSGFLYFNLRRGLFMARSIQHNTFAVVLLKASEFFLLPLVVPPSSGGNPGIRIEHRFFLPCTLLCFFYTRADPLFQVQYSGEISPFFSRLLRPPRTSFNVLPEIPSPGVHLEFQSLGRLGDSFP